MFILNSLMEAKWVNIWRRWKLVIQLMLEDPQVCCVVCCRGTWNIQFVFWSWKISLIDNGYFSISGLLEYVGNGQFGIKPDKKSPPNTINVKKVNMIAGKKDSLYYLTLWKELLYVPWRDLIVCTVSGCCRCFISYFLLFKNIFSQSDFNYWLGGSIIIISIG